jgi:hypothetical protein
MHRHQLETLVVPFVTSKSVSCKQIHLFRRTLQQGEHACWCCILLVNCKFQVVLLGALVTPRHLLWPFHADNVCTVTYGWVMASEFFESFHSTVICFAVIQLATEQNNGIMILVVSRVWVAKPVTLSFMIQLTWRPLRQTQRNLLPITRTTIGGIKYNLQFRSVIGMP